MSVIIRRPHAYRFRETHPGVPIPRFVFLDGDGKVKETFEAPNEGGVRGFVEAMTKTR